jgi:hypothetical protein
LIKDKPIFEGNEFKKNCKSDNNAINNIGLRNQAFGNNLPKPLFYQQKPNYKEDFSKDVNYGIHNDYAFQTTNNEKLGNLNKEEELDEFDLVYQKYKNEKTNKLPEKRIVSNHISKPHEKRADNNLLTEPINKENNRPRSRIKSALQCIEEMFEVKKENIYTVTETNPENKPNKLLFNEVVKDSKFNPNTVKNGSVNVIAKNDIDAGIESMINNFPTRPGSRIRAKKDQLVAEKTEFLTETKGKKDL